MDQLKPLLRSMVPANLKMLAGELGVPSYRADQLAQWLFKGRALAWEQMSNVPLSLRRQLQDKYDLNGLEPAEKQISADGTRKYLFRLRDGLTVESVLIPMDGHATFCISTQVGCAMACTFCATARGGLKRNLTCGEIIEQVLRLDQDQQDGPVPGTTDRPFNVVYMGMGEPLDNWEAVRDSVRVMMDEQGLAMSRRRIQISTSGPGEGLKMLLEDPPGVGLTVSLGGSDDEERRRVMPVPGRTPLTEVLNLAGQYAKVAGRRVTLAWVLIKGLTDDPGQAERIARLAAGGPFKVNLIPMNPLDDAVLEPSTEQDTLAFQEIIRRKGVDAFVRASGGRDIAAACGQLRRRRLEAG